MHSKNKIKKTFEVFKKYKTQKNKNSKSREQKKIGSKSYTGMIFQKFD